MNKSSSRNQSRQFLVTVMVFTVLILVALIQKGFDSANASFKKEQVKATMAMKVPLVPNTSALKIISLGYPQVTADILWLQTIQYFGGGNPYGKYLALGPMVERITDLDSKFEYPYQFGMVVLPFMDNVDAAIRLGEKAQVEIPGNGLLTYYHASNLHLYKKDYANASIFYDKASKEVGAPGAAAQLAAVTKSKIDSGLIDREAAIYYWQVIAEKATNLEDKKRYENWAEHMYMVYVMEKAALDYKEKNGSYPTSLNDLVTAGYLKEIPRSPVKRVFNYNNQTGKISFDDLEDED